MDRTRLRDLKTRPEYAVIVHKLLAAPGDFAADSLNEAMQLRELLAKVFNGQDVPYVNAVLAAPLAYTQGTAALRHVMVLHQDDLTEALQKEPARLKPTAVKRIAQALGTFPVAGE